MISSTLYQAISPNESKLFDTVQLRDHFLIDTLFIKDKISTYYTTYDRFVVGAATPDSTSLKLEPIDQMRADYFLERREMGIINVGNLGVVTVDGVAYELENEEALYIGKGAKEVVFSNIDELLTKYQML